MTGCATNIGKQEEILEAYVTQYESMTWQHLGESEIR